MAKLVRDQTLLDFHNIIQVGRVDIPLLLLVLGKWQESQRGKGEDDQIQMGSNGQMDKGGHWLNYPG